MSEQNDEKKNEAPEISLHPFHPLQPFEYAESKENVNQNGILTKPKVYKKKEAVDTKDITNSTTKASKKKSTVISAGLMMTDACLGTTIFTFAVKAKTFGLLWFLVFVIIIGIINYWSIMAGAKASSKCDEDDYSEITLKFLGKKAKIILNVVLIIYSYACMMCHLALIYPLFGRFLHSTIYMNKYDTYDDFENKVWEKLYIKLPFFTIVSLAVSFMCLIDDINKLNFTSYVTVAVNSYALIVIMVQCRSYYQYYKKTVYVEEDESTHPNWTDLSQAFKSDLDFFKGIANLICAYACHPNIFPIYAGFKKEKQDEEERKEGLKKMSLGTIFGTILTTALHIVSIVCSFLTDPITPEDLIIYRKSKDNGKDIPMGIAKLAVFISLVFTLPIYYFTLRLSVSDSFLNGKLTQKFNIIFTFCSVFGSSIVAIVYDKILNYLSYIGGFISVFICYLIPVLLFIKAYGKPITYWKNLIQFIFAIILCMIGVTAGILTLIDDIKG